MRRIVALALLVACTGTAGAALKMKRSNAMAARAAIDGVCDFYNARPGLIRHVHLARVHETGGAGRWKTSSDAAVAKLEAGGSIDADFAEIYSRDGKIVYASLTRGEATGDGGGAREYCYINGKLARASTQVVDASTDHAISRRLYFDVRGGLFADTGPTVRDIAKRRNATVPEPYTGPLAIPIYATPPALPFYGAYQAALAGTLSPL